MDNTRASDRSIEFNERFSTTRNIVKRDFFLPSEISGLNDGGLRTRGYGKRSELNKPLISVITVVYDAVENLESAIQSVLNQTYDNIEYILIDGGSTDGTLDIIRKYEGVIDYWVSEPDSGVYDAMNKGVGLSQGEYVLFLGSDDSLFDVLHEAVGCFGNGIGIVSYYGNVILSKDKRVYDGKFYPLKLFIKNIPHQAIFYSKYVFDAYKFNCKYKYVADYELNLKVFSNNKYGLKYIPLTIAKYNNEDGLSSTVVDRAFSLDKPVLIKKSYSAFYYMIYRLVRFVAKGK